KNDAQNQRSQTEQKLAQGQDQLRRLSALKPSLASTANDLPTFTPSCRKASNEAQESAFDPGKHGLIVCTSDPTTLPATVPTLEAGARQFGVLARRASERISNRRPRPWTQRTSDTR